MAIRISNMIPWPIVCEIQVCANSSTKTPASTARNSAATRPTPARSPRTMCSSIATFVSHGCTSCSSAVATMTTRPSSTLRQCGRR